MYVYFAKICEILKLLKIYFFQIKKFIYKLKGHTI